MEQFLNHAKKMSNWIKSDPQRRKKLHSSSLSNMQTRLESLFDNMDTEDGDTIASILSTQTTWIDYTSNMAAIRAEIEQREFEREFGQPPHKKRRLNKNKNKNLNMDDDDTDIESDVGEPDPVDAMKALIKRNEAKRLRASQSVGKATSYLLILIEKLMKKECRYAPQMKRIVSLSVGFPYTYGSVKNAEELATNENPLMSALIIEAYFSEMNRQYIQYPVKNELYLSIKLALLHEVQKSSLYARPSRVVLGLIEVLDDMDVGAEDIIGKFQDKTRYLEQEAGFRISNQFDYNGAPKTCLAYALGHCNSSTCLKPHVCFVCKEPHKLWDCDATSCPWSVKNRLRRSYANRFNPSGGRGRGNKFRSRGYRGGYRGRGFRGGYRGGNRGNNRWNYGNQNTRNTQNTQNTNNAPAQPAASQ
eukprot:346956_1